jgi:LPS-assembly lipoprotein
MPTASGGAGVAQRDLAAVDVAIIADRPGQELRQELQTRFEGSSGATVPPKYKLGVNYSIAGEVLGIQPDSTANRVRLVARAEWTLTAPDGAGPPLTHGLARGFDDVNIFDQQYFAADLGVEQAQTRLAKSVAEQITLQLAGYFRHQAGLGVSAGTAGKAGG